MGVAGGVVLGRAGADCAVALGRRVGAGAVALHDPAAAVHQGLHVVRPDAEASHAGPGAPAPVDVEGPLYGGSQQEDQYQGRQQGCRGDRSAHGLCWLYPR